MEVLDPKNFNKEEKVLILKKCRVNPGDGVAVSKKPGDVVSLKGLDKVELVKRGLATLNLSKKDEVLKAYKEAEAKKSTDAKAGK